MQQEVQILIMSAESLLSEYLITGKISPPPKYTWPNSILRREARVVFFRVYPRLKGRVIEVHHRVPLEWKSKFPLADPNRIANLQGLYISTKLRSYGTHLEILTDDLKGNQLLRKS